MKFSRREQCLPMFRVGCVHRHLVGTVKLGRLFDSKHKSVRAVSNRTAHSNSGILITNSNRTLTAKAEMPHTPSVYADHRCNQQLSYSDKFLLKRISVIERYRTVFNRAPYFHCNSALCAFRRSPSAKRALECTRRLVE